MKLLILLLSLLIFASIQSYSFQNEVKSLETSCDDTYSYDIDSILANSRNFIRDVGGLITKADTLAYINFIDTCESIKLLRIKEIQIEQYIPIANKLKLPSKAKIIEYKSLENAGIKNRALVYWIENPRVNLACLESDEGYDCATAMYGQGQYYGKIKFSLINTLDTSIINTIDFVGSETSVDTDGNVNNETYERMDLPFCSPTKSNIRNMSSRVMFHVIGGDTIREGLSEIIHLDDYNGDGDSLEFALYLTGNCMFCESTLFGFSKKQDKLINYSFDLKVIDKDSTGKLEYSQMQTKFLGYTFAMKFKNKKLKYQMDYRGRGGALEKFDLEYDSQNEKFLGVYDIKQTEFEDGEGASWISCPEELE